MTSVHEFAELLVADGFRGAIETDAASSVVYGTDNSVYQLRPLGALVPADAGDLARIVRCNHLLATPFDLVARGGGTGTNGQSLTNGFVVDTRRAMDAIVSIDPIGRTAVVQPGVVLGRLNSELQQHGLFFAPHVSTATRATIGGMASTDAAGKGSLVHGRMNDHVESVTAILDDGTSWTFGPVDTVTLAELVARDDRVGELHRKLVTALDGVGADSFPDVPRGFTGYNLLDAASLGDDLIDTAKLLCGSEGTLALLAELTIRLTPLPVDPHLAVVAYESFTDAVRDSNRLKVTRPTAIECLDERTISLATTSPAFPRLAALLGGDFERGSLLLMEYDGTEGLEALRRILPEKDGVIATAITSEPSDIAAAWKVRADAVGLLGKAVDGRRSIAFVEDCAVPPTHLDEFVAEYRAVLDRHGLSYGMFGHADIGCIHVRPALNLYDPDHERLLRTISDEVAALVARFGGVLWGEHGRGFRGEYLDLDAETVARMRAIKTAFDPRNTLNRGKLYAPLDVDVALPKIDEVPLRVHRDRKVAAAERELFDTAFGCNGNGICHHWGDAEVMCPSYKATLDPRLSPKGRADLLRAWLTAPDDAELASHVADSLHQCLSCGACTGRCPVQVDIPELKSRFLERYGEPSRQRRLRNALLSRFETVLPMVQAVAPVMRLLQKLSAPLVRSVLGVVDLPAVPSGTLASRLRDLDVPLAPTAAEVGDATVVILPDAFTAYLEPDVLEAAIAVLRAVGETPAAAPFTPSGKFDHVKGRRERFGRAVAKQRVLIEELSRADVALVTIEPAVSLLPGHEYVASDPSFPHSAVTSLADFLADRLALLPTPAADSSPVHPKSAQLFGHCTEVSIAPQRMATYRTMLEVAGYEVNTELTTCCGMAGIFGHEEESQEMSTALFDSGWRPRLQVAADVRCASGSSCRTQAERFGHSDLLHPIQVLAAALS